jgi:hypothetical protein
MLSQSYDRRLCARSVWTGLVALVVLLAVVAPSAAANSPLQAAGGFQYRVMSAAQASMVAVADTDPSSQPVVLPSQPRRGGYVITDDQLEMEQDFSVASVLIAHFPGIRIYHGTEIDRVASAQHTEMTGAPCYLQVFVNGVYVPSGGVDMNVRDIAAIEYHTPGNVPVQYQNRLEGAACGVLLFWSKTS